MPEVQDNHLDVSREEERYLRRTFRRFALPYVVLGLALGAFAGALPGWLGSADGSGDGESGPVDGPRLREEITALRGDVASLSQRAVAAESALARTRDRLVALEGRSSASDASSGSADDAEEITRRVEASLRRIEVLEQQISGGAPTADASRLEERVAALGGRLARVEGELRAERPEGPPADLAH